MIAYKFDLATMKPVPTMRQKVEKLERSMYAMPQAECPVRHYFAPGVYAREITIPKGVTLVGAIHKTENLAILSKGRVVLVTDDEPQTLEAPCIVRVKVGAKNVFHALEDVVWTNFLQNPDNETDPDKLVEVFTHSKACELLGGSHNPQLVAQREREKLEKAT